MSKVDEKVKGKKDKKGEDLSVGELAEQAGRKASDFAIVAYDKLKTTVKSMAKAGKNLLSHLQVKVKAMWAAGKEKLENGKERYAEDKKELEAREEIKELAENEETKQDDTTFTSSLDGGVNSTGVTKTKYKKYVANAEANEPDAANTDVEVSQEDVVEDVSYDGPDFA